MNLPKPVKNRVLGEVLAEETSKSGLVMASANLNKHRCKVLAIGPDVKYVKVGDIVRFDPNYSSFIEVNGKNHVFAKEERGVTFVL